MDSTDLLGPLDKGDLFLHPSGAITAPSPSKRRKISLEESVLGHELIEIKQSLPILRSSDYFIKPSLKELAFRELLDPGYCCRVPDFTIGRLGHGSIKFIGKTDVKWLDLEKIVKFCRHEVVVYEDEVYKPAIGEGLNKSAEVTIVLLSVSSDYKGERSSKVVDRLRSITERQGAHFISYESNSGEWKFLVNHFSRFGLTEDDEEDIVMDDATAIQDAVDISDGNDAVNAELYADPIDQELFVSLPSHLGLDPARMKEMKMLMFNREDEEDEIHQQLLSDKEQYPMENKRSPIRGSHIGRLEPATVRKTPLPLLEYHGNTFDSSAPRTLMSQENKGLPLTTMKSEGFKLDSEYETPVSTYHSHNVVDAALFMGRSFRVGWGPGGVLVHTGSPVGYEGHGILSSVISLEKVGLDKVARDESETVEEENVSLFFAAPLVLHKSMDHVTVEVRAGSFVLSLQKLVSDRLTLPDICRNYIDLVEKQLEVPTLPASVRMSSMQQVMVWELIRVLFSDREINGPSKFTEADNEEDMMQDGGGSPPETDTEALPLMRRAEFSYWLQESVYHRVQEDVGCLADSGGLEHIFLLLTGRQLDAAVQLAAARGDVRLACLLSQASGSMVNRSDISRQLDMWSSNGLDYNFIETERIRLLELLGGHIHRSQGKKIDWKRFLGLLMWYELPSYTHLPTIFQTYQSLLSEGKVPFPVPIYIDEGPDQDLCDSRTSSHFDLAYYLMLLHASKGTEFGHLKSMFSAFASTDDPLDYHMIWHQRSVLEAIGAFSSNSLHTLDVGYVSQLLSLGQCHWAIYVILHMPHREDTLYLHPRFIREILFQYCDVWSSQEEQHKFIEDLGVPSAWLHEAMAVYSEYQGDMPKALEHFLQCSIWPKAHTILVTLVAPSLFLSGQHTEIWRLATSMEDYKSEIENWDLGAGIYVSFYTLRSSMRDDDKTITKLESLESKDEASRVFFGHLNESLRVLGKRLPMDARVVYTKMAEEICSLLLSNGQGDSSLETQMRCFETMTSAPIPEDSRSRHLEDAVALFTCFLSGAAA
ncbi:hypothetical protein Droror1_Dr00006190 [Drosera rotundifolia]